VKGAEPSWTIDDSLEELALLATNAGAAVVGAVVQRRQSPTPAYYLGKGKVEEIIALKEKLNYNMVIFDDELSPVQQRNLENSIDAKIIDRTALILDIFARRAKTKEGRLQVELAQHEYLLPRLAGQWSHLERLGGGIGTRGPGESQIETDRRLVRNKIHRLQEQIKDIRRQRTLYRRKRKDTGIPIAAIVGYTNSGKSTLLNRISGSKVLTEDKLFATLDPTTRRVTLPSGRQFLLTDTVGFIQKLPTTLVAAFRATLEELDEADALLHVVDISHHNAVEQNQTVEKTLAELGLQEKPRITVLNKLDLVVESESEMQEFCREKGSGQQDMVMISAAKGWGIRALLEEVEKKLLGSGSHNTGYVTPDDTVSG